MEDILNYMIADVNKQHQLLENEIALLRDLLKPWPRKKTAGDNEEGKSATTVNEIQKGAEILSHVEKQALSQVEELLQKAEKARCLKSRTSKVKRDSEQVTCNNQTRSVEIPKRAEAHENLKTSQELSVDTEKNSKLVVLADGACLKTQALTKQTFKNQQLESQNSLIKAKNISSNRSSSASFKGINKQSKDSSTRPSSHRPSSSHRPACVRSHHTPVYMTAPFKTSENAGFPKHRKNYILNHKSSEKTLRKAPVSAGIEASRTLSEMPSVARNRSDQSLDKCSLSKSQTCSSKIDCVKENHVISNSSSTQVDFTSNKPTDHITEDILATDISFNPFSSSHKQTSISNTSKPCVPIEQSATEDRLAHAQNEATSDLFDSLQEQFTLQKNGLDLKIPGKLKKLAITNKCLREKCSMVRLDKKGSSSNPAQQFTERLCAGWTVSKELTTCISALTCWRSHQILLDTLQNLCLDQLSENTPISDLYRARRTVEFVLTTFAELKEIVDFCTQVKHRQVDRVMNKHNEQEAEQRCSWSGMEQNTGSKGDLREHLQASKRWAHLQFTEKFLQTHISLVKALQREWHCLLESDDRSPSVLHGVHGLLTSCGQFLPVLVENKLLY